MTWSIGDKKMVSIISRPGKEKRQWRPHLTVASLKSGEIFTWKKYAECCGYSLGSRLLPQILAPQLDQLKRDAGTQKKLCGHRPLLTCSHSDGLQAKCIFSTTAKVSTHVTHHWKDGILVIWALPWSQNHYSNCSQNKQTNQQFKNWGNTHVRHQGLRIKALTGKFVCTAQSGQLMDCFGQKINQPLMILDNLWFINKIKYWLWSTFNIHLQ